MILNYSLSIYQHTHYCHFMFTLFKNKLLQNTIYSITINRYSTSPLLQFFEQGQALPKWDRESKPIHGNSLLYSIHILTIQ